MGVDDEYKMVSSQDEANEHLLETNTPISRSTYKKRGMLASVAVGALVGAAVTFLFSLMFAPKGYSVNRNAEAETPEKVEVAPATVTVTTTAVSTSTRSVMGPATTVYRHSDSANLQEGVDDAHMVKNTGVIMDCGHTVEEARAKGCVFDVMMQDWMPAPCHDEVLSERYLAIGNWTWWADPEATRAIPLEDMRKGEHPVIYVVQDYHRSHCIYAWEKMVRALRNNWPLIEELVSYDHVMHCRHSTLSKESESVSGVRAPTAWTRCALVEDWKGRFPANSVSSIDKRLLAEVEEEMKNFMIDP